MIMGGYEGKSGWAEYHPAHGPDIYFELGDEQGSDSYAGIDGDGETVRQVPITTAEATRREAVEADDQPSA